MDAIIALSETLGAALKKHGYMLSLAESCTGGMVAMAVTETAGSSAWFDRGFVTYSNAAKQEMLGVSSQTLETYGAVSEQTACEMVAGALRNSQANIAGGITGIAGPSGGSKNKPIGTVCFAWSTQAGEIISSTEHFTGNRQQIRQQSTLYLMTAILNTLQN